MRSIVRRAVVVGTLATIGAAAALVFIPGAPALVVDVYAIVLAAVVMLALVRTVRLFVPRRGASPFDNALARLRSKPTATPVELDEDRDVVLSRLNTFHYYVRVRPILREFADHRLRIQYGVDLDGEPDRARELIRSNAWDVVRPDRGPPADRLARGPSIGEQRTVLDELERL
jgi:hypothetical protein